MRKIFLLAFLSIFFIPSVLYSQNDKGAAMVLTCPFENGSGREPKEAFTWNPPDQKVILISQVDSIVRSCIKATVVKVMKEEDDHFEIVINTGDFYFWYYGVVKPLVKRGDVVAAGQTLGIYKFGTELEFRMFNFDEMVDPRELLECKVPKAE
jgi:hypothetical protein